MKTIFFIVVLLAATGIFIVSARKILNLINLGKPINRFNDVKTRIKNVFVIAIAQKKLFRDPVAGIVHALIFWGFILFISAVVETFIQGFLPSFNFSFLGYIFSLMTITQDLFGLLVIVSVLISLYRRFVLKVKRLDVEKHGKFDAAFILIMILFVVISMFGQNASHYVMAGKLDYEVRPIISYLAGIMYQGDKNAASLGFEIFWWLHVFLILGFLNYLPYSKHLHVLTSIPNVYFSKTGDEKNILQPINFEDENAEYFGADDVQKFSWKQLLDGFSCTECGRCTAVCPANTVGKPLSPRKIITDIRDRTQDKGVLLFSKDGDVTIEDKPLLGGYTSTEEIWACTTCMACVQECPVMIEHIDSIVEMRRHLVLTESNFPSELQNTFRSLENNFSPWAFNPSDRAEWAEGLNIKTLAEDPGGDYLFWVGCAGSYDNRYKKVSVSFSKIMQNAGIDFRILGNEEKCNGDTARRLGNEYLAQEMMKGNIETLNGYGVKKIVTACPHCYNSIKNEYKQFGGNFEVYHHSEIINEVVKNGKIKLKKQEHARKITFHDSCYIGRYNDIYEQPRTALIEIAGDNLVEMERNRSKGFCCGAGGGRMFLEDSEESRVNIERTKEAVATGAETIASACPFCMTMISDGVKSLDKSETIEIQDIAEIVYNNQLTH